MVVSFLFDGGSNCGGPLFRLLFESVCNDSRPLHGGDRAPFVRWQRNECLWWRLLHDGAHAPLWWQRQRWASLCLCQQASIVVIVLLVGRVVIVFLFGWGDGRLLSGYGVIPLLFGGDGDRLLFGWDVTSGLHYGNCATRWRWRAPHRPRQQFFVAVIVWRQNLLRSCQWASMAPSVCLSPRNSSYYFSCLRDQDDDTLINLLEHATIIIHGGMQQQFMTMECLEGGSGGFTRW